MTAITEFKRRLPGLLSGLSQFRRWATNTSANISILAGVTFIPLTIAVTAAVDLSNAIRIKTSLQAAADAGVLAAATALASGYDDTKKETIATDAFNANISQELLNAFEVKPVVTIDFDTRTVHMDVEVSTDQLLTNLITDAITIGVSATAIADQGTPICLMALNPTMEGALSIDGTPLVMAEECAVQVNSNHAEAMRQKGNGEAHAESFCVHGDYSGKADAFTPLPRRHCNREQDPLAAQFAEDLWDAGVEAMGCRSDKPRLDNSSSDVITMSPSTGKGAYCDGVHISKGTLVLEPGLHVFRGPLTVQTGHGALEGDGVTILLDGPGAYFQVQAQSTIDVKGPASGELFEGIVVAQHPDSAPPHNTTSEIIGGGSKVFDGIMYFPTQHLKITGGGDLGADAIQFAILADSIELDGNGELTIRIRSDAVGSGLPALPEANETIRLSH